MTPEKILEMLPKELICPESGDCSQCSESNDCEEKKAISGHNNLLNACANALAGKVVAVDRLLTKEEIMVLSAQAYCESPNTSKVLDNSLLNSIARIIFEAQQRKANREKHD